MTEWRIREGIVLTNIQGVWLLAADKEARKFCPYIRQINEMAAFVWNQLETGSSFEEILSAIDREYEIPEGQDPGAEVRAYLEALKDQGYLTREDRNG